MPTHNIDSIQACFASRLTTLEHLMKTAQTHFADRDAFLQERIVADMLPFGTQIAFTCNQPRNFALWCADQPADNLNPDVTSLTQAYKYIANTQELLAGIHAEDAKLTEVKRIDLGQNLYAELSGSAYVDEFLLPNFYFHLVTAYNILRMVGVPIGKRDYMLHLLPLVQQH
ncbi:DUF1993 domain-containing protein [filamentous cyanobacterium LEGE 11480]|uniref:DUF1993 domain-containing protein n=1 Tax=Romeriopsis navalis LEGE 11480 TaxID=2777977 RepID=A0A928Z384_9CYAN|nr:DUF1993 domain-containing protein [Romeriopsis navalis]MBE9031246.1 DUF1993 domain-containing protein [Romeriopsis navalis LEGE 11480]